MMNFDMSDGKMNGYELYVIQSEEYADEILRQFKRTYPGGVDPNEYLNDVCEDLGISNEDLTPASIDRISAEISNYLRLGRY